MIQLALLAMAGCIPVAADSDRVRARDLAAPADDTPVALAPAPGVQRVFRIGELQRLLARWPEIHPDREICVERPVTPLDPERLLDAMRRQLPQARIELRDYSRAPAPEGQLEFPVSGLRPGPDGGLWNGFVRYAGSRRFVIWAKVSVEIVEPRVIAVEDLKPGRVVESSQLRVETRAGFPSAIPFAASVEQIAGKVVRRLVAAGGPVCLACVEPPREVARGDTVRVEVRIGSARLEFEGRAESSGGAGQTIPVLNPDSRRRFLARVESKGRVSVGETKP